MFSRQVALLALPIAISILPWAEAIPLRSPKTEEKKNETLTLPAIIYGPINSQLGNHYKSASSNHTGGNSSAPVASVVYESTNVQANNKYVTISHAGNVYLIISTTNGVQNDHPDYVPAIIKSQNDNSEGYLFNASDPMVQDMEEYIEKYNSYQLEFNRVVHLGNAFLADNEITPSLKEDAKNDLGRQTLETELLSEVLKHKLQLIELHGMVISMYEKLVSKVEITSEENGAVREKLIDALLSEDTLVEKTGDFIVNVL